jgi:hypothetical protein
MLMNPAHVPGETVGQLYNRMVAYARTFDPRFVGGAASVPEMDRVKKAIETFERQAAEKKAGDPRDSELTVLHRRADEGRGRIISLQGELKLKARVSREIAILVTPADLKEPAPITRSGNSIEENIAVMTNLATGHEAMARRLDSILNEWPRLSPEQQNRKLILALAERLNG